METQPLIQFDSRPDSKGQKTRLTIDPNTATIRAIKLYKTGQSRPTLTLNSTVISLFTIRFTKFSLTDNKRLPEYVEYSMPPLAADREDIECDVVTADRKRTITYTSIPASVVSGSAATYDAINVVLTFTAPSDPAGYRGESIDAGWIDLDISFDYPSQVSGGSSVAWETEIVYPEMLFNKTAVDDYLLLDPVGRLGGFPRLSATETLSLMPMQFAALYKHTVTSARINRISGIALSATDSQGHTKHLRYRRTGANANPSLAFHLALPIHLNTINQVKNNYVRPDTYTLSGGSAPTDLGFSGAQMRYRIRAFQVDGVTANAPVDWHDVVDIYRRWLRNSYARYKQPSFYYKHYPKPATNVVKAMSPFTVIANYGLDGQIDPTAVDSQLPDLNKWLEIHPILVNGTADMPANNADQTDRNESLQEFLVRIKNEFNVPTMKLEAQIWGFEQEGFYQFLGAFPPATDLISNTPLKFKTAVINMRASNSILASVTSDPLNVNFARYRYRGHLVNVGGAWREAILQAFPAAIRNATCADPPHTNPDRRFVASTCPDAATMATSLKLDENGNRGSRYEALTRFYNIHGELICPTSAVEDLYCNTWLRDGLMNWDVGLIEFMKHHPVRFYCYDKNHQHIVPTPTGLSYDNVIGRGPWYIKRLQKILGRVQDLGKEKFGAQRFSLTNEFHIPETLVPFIDELYEYEASSIKLYERDMRSRALVPNRKDERRVQVFQFVYGDFVSMKMNLADTGPNLHPGYKEAKIDAAQADARPDFMLRAARDNDTSSDLNFDTWKGQAYSYFNANYTVERSGLAPQNYPTSSAPGAFSYNHCVQSVFNLRSHIMRYGMAAVLGERIYLFSTLMEQPYYYNQEAINMAVRAAHMQMFFKGFFRGGYMLGQTLIKSGNRSAWAWRVHRRQFFDVSLLASALYTPTEIYGNNNVSPPIPPSRLFIMDFISRGIDTLNLTPVGNYVYAAHENPPNATRITTDRIQHMIWRTSPSSGARRAVLYAFANVGNTDQSITFLYGRGLEGSASWRRTVYTFDGSDPNGAPGAVKVVRVGVNNDAVRIPARSCVGIQLVPGQ